MNALKYRVGDKVLILDRAAHKVRDGFVRRTYPNGSLDVFLTRYNSVIKLGADGKSDRDRFELQEAP